MSGNEYLADTNALLYLLNGNSCMASFVTKRMAVSVITEMELLSFPDISDDEELTIRTMLTKCDGLSLSETVKEKTIELCRKYRIKLPDAIIAATAIINDLTLLTADTGFRKITEIKLELLSPM